MKKILAAAAFGAIGLSATSAAAQSCGEQYVVQRGDTLSAIADRAYKNAGYWTRIHNDNKGTIGSKPNLLQVGMRLTLPCYDAQVVATTAPTQVEKVELTAAPAQTNPSTAAPLPMKINLLTGDDFAPFTDRSLEEGGLLAEVVTAAMEASVGESGYQTFWVNDWNSHLNDLMPAGIMEMAYPWARPDCEGMPSNERCTNFHFSEPMFEYLVQFYNDTSRPMPFEKDEDMVGRTICRPLGYLTHMLDIDGRNWVADNKITLAQPDKVADCFDLLLAGEVDGVILNEFTARDAIYAMGIQDRVQPAGTKPISITGLHVLIHKNHAQADQLLETVNAGLAKIKDSGAYQEIVSRHMETVWAGYQTN